MTNTWNLDVFPSFFIYRPIGITLVSNLVMFIYASRFFNKLQKKKKYLSQVSSQKSPAPNARKLSTQMSVKVKGLISQKANIEK